MEERKTHDFMAMEVLCPNADKTDANRLYMFGSSHISQAANLMTPEIPFIFTNFENEVGKYSDLGYNALPNDIEIINKIVKNENVYYLIYHNLENDTYDIFERRKEFWLSEKYGFIMNNEVVDSVKVGDIIPANTKLNKCYNYDESDNFMYGVNLKSIYYTEKCKTLEDPIVLSRTAATKLGAYNVEPVTIMINNNDLLLNLSNDTETYRTFPDINEYIDTYLCVRRRIDKNKLYKFDDLTINSISPSDEKFYVKGKVVDIDIYCNMKDEELEGNYNSQIRSCLRKRRKFNNEFLKVTESLMENHHDKCSSQFIQMYNRIKMEQNKIKFSYENSIFSGIVIKFSILKENELSIGSKISNRYGKL